MKDVRIQELMAATAGRALGIENFDGKFNRVVIDSRNVRPGDLFWAVRGERLDGHDFVSEAISRGAVACVVQREVDGLDAGPSIVVDQTLSALGQFARWYRLQFDISVIGVTGSAGKTTAREMIHAVLRQRCSGIRSLKNYNNRYGLPLSLFQLEAGHEYAVVEMGASRVGEIADLSAIAKPNIGVVTSLGDAHLGEFGSKEQIFTAKSELLESLPSDGKAFLPGDDPQLRRLAQNAAGPVIFVGEGEQNDVQASEVEQRNGQLFFQVGETQFCVNVAGKHHLNSALIAVALGREFGMEAAAIAAGLESFEAVPGRCQLEEIGPWSVIDDTYNASPSSMQAACELLKNYEGAQKKILVTGDMLELGDEACKLHKQIGTWAWDAGVERLFVLGKHRHDVAAGAIAAGFSAGQVSQCERLPELLAELDCQLEPGDVVLVKGSRALKMERVVDWLRKRSLQAGLCNFQAKQSRSVA